jgi:hypothetical protein
MAARVVVLSVVAVLIVALIAVLVATGSPFSAGRTAALAVGGIVGLCIGLWQIAARAR